MYNKLIQKQNSLTDQPVNKKKNINSRADHSSRATEGKFASKENPSQEQEWGSITRNVMRSQLEEKNSISPQPPTEAIQLRATIPTVTEPSRSPVLQLKAPSIGLADDSVIQKKGENKNTPTVSSPIQRSNRTGLPDNLKTGIENLSGYSMDDVRVHYNSPKPSQLKALAYTKGTEIHVGPGQEKHLPHEAWHVVQQKQGRVKPTIQAKGVVINNDPTLEREADEKGREALRIEQKPVFEKGGDIPGNWGRQEFIEHDLNQLRHPKLLEVKRNREMERATVLQKVEIQEVRDKIGENEKLHETFHYWIHYAVKQLKSSQGKKYNNPVEVLSDRTLTQIMESLEEWSEDKKFKELKKEMNRLDSVTPQKNPQNPNYRDLTGNTISGKDIQQQLREAKQAIENGSYLVRKMSKVEAALFISPKDAENIDKIRRKGLLNANAFPVERSVAFSIDTSHKFGKQDREKDDKSYAQLMKIKLTPKLKGYLMANLWSTNRKQYRNNPQFKLEHGKYNIIIPETGWSAFWRIASPQESWVNWFLRCCGLRKAHGSKLVTIEQITTTRGIAS